MRPWLSLFAALFAGVAAANAAAAELRLEVEIPRMAVAEYHAPYLAFWLKHADSGEIVPLGLWYDDQEKWLKDLRLWWRRTGRTQSAPYDGLTGATRRPGTHSVDFSALPALASEDLPLARLHDLPPLLVRRRCRSDPDALASETGCSC